MADFYNGTLKTPYVRLQTRDGRVKLGLNDPVTQANNFMDAIGLSSVKIDVRSDQVDVEVSIDILPGAWNNRAFDDVLGPLVEEPYRTDNQRPEGSAADNPDRGIWVLQFGWRDQILGDILSSEIVLVTVSNTVAVSPEAYGAITLSKTFIMLPVTYLAQTFLSELRQVREYLVLQDPGSTENAASTQIIPRTVFDLLVKDLQAVHGADAPGLPTLDSFLFAGSNFLNIGAEQAYNEWVERPIANTSSIMQVVDDTKKNHVSVRRWLDAWLGENDMDIIPVPLRTFGNGRLGFIIRYAVNKTEGANVSTHYERSATGVVPPQPYATAWKPVLSTYTRNSIVENAAYTFDAGTRSAAYIEAFSRRFGPRPDEDTRAGDVTSDRPKDDSAAISPRIILLELLKLPNKSASLTLMGQPQISIMDLIDVDSGSPLFDGQYQVLGISHQISKDSFSTDLDCIRIVPSERNTRVSGVNEGDIR